MMDNAKIGVALVGGYLLGRTRKARLAIGLGMFLAGRRLDLDPRAIGRAIAGSPLIGSLGTQVREEIVGATKSAAADALTQRVNGLADSLHERTRGLSAGPPEEDDDAPRDSADPDEPDAPEERASDEGEGDAGGEAGTPRRRARRDTGTGGTARRGTAKAAARSAQSTAASRKKGASGGGKARATGRKKSGAARGAAGRGDDDA